MDIPLAISISMQTRMVQDLLDRLELSAEDIPVASCNGKLMRGQTPQQKRLDSIQGSTNLRSKISSSWVPGPPAAAVYAASEGLDVLTIERLAPGGPGRLSHPAN